MHGWGLDPFKDWSLQRLLKFLEIFKVLAQHDIRPRVLWDVGATYWRGTRRSKALRDKEEEVWEQGSVLGKGRWCFLEGCFTPKKLLTIFVGARVLKVTIGGWGQINMIGRGLEAYKRDGIGVCLESLQRYVLYNALCRKTNGNSRNSGRTVAPDISILWSHGENSLLT